MTLIQNPIHNIEGYLHSLSVAIGARPTGSRNNTRAVGYIGDLFERRGYAVEYQGFDCLDWKGGSIELSADGEIIPAGIAPYSLPCDVVGVIEPVGDLTQLEAASLEGKIAVLSGELTREAYMPKNFPFGSFPEHARIIRLLEGKRPLAVITVSPDPGEARPVIEDGDFELPCAMVSSENGRRLLELPPGQVRLRIQSERKPARAANVIARRSSLGAREKLVFIAHLDTQPDTPGAFDNASGIATLLALCPLPTTKFTDFDLEFVAVNGEDHYSNAGEAAYLDQYGGGFERVVLAINVDGIGLKGGQESIAYIECPQRLVELAENARQGFPEIETIDPWFEGDHMVFAMNRVPALALTSGKGSQLKRQIIHSPRDTIEHIDPGKIWGMALFLSEILSAFNPRKP